MYRLLFLSCCLIFNVCISFGQAYDIDVNLQGYTNDTLILGYHFGNKQYVIDTSILQDKTNFNFKGEEPLKPGMVLIITKPENKFFQFLISDEENQKFDIQIDMRDPNPIPTSTSSKENKLFSEYLNLLSVNRKKLDEIQKEYEVEEDETKKAYMKSQIEALDKEVKLFQENVSKELPGSLFAAIIKSNSEIEIPLFEDLDAKDKDIERYKHYKKHYFSNVDLTDRRLLYSPIMHAKVSNYIDKMTVQHPDSIAKSIDVVLNLAEPNEDVFRYFLSTYLSHYGNSKYVGLDAVYVHLVDNYYSKGKTPWVEQETLEKIQTNADDLRPTLIGKIAPNVKVKDKDNNPVSLHDIEGEYVVLVFWAPDCGHCKKAIPKMTEFYEVYKKTGVEVVAFCTKTTSKVKDCWEFLDENDLYQWINVVDPFVESNYSVLYNVKNTPKVFVLDENKKIVSKGIGTEQLPEVIDALREMKARL